MSETGEQFVPSYFNFLESELVREIAGCPYGLYLILRRYVCRAREGHHLSEFYRRGYLAVEGYLGTWASIFEKNKSTILRWLKALEECQAVNWYHRSQGEGDPNILILGVVEWVPGSNRPIEKFFIDHVSIAQAEHGLVAECRLPRADEIAWPAHIDLAVAPMQQSMQQLAQRLMQRSNREEIIEKSNREENNLPALRADHKGGTDGELPGQEGEGSEPIREDEPVLRDTGGLPEDAETARVPAHHSEDRPAGRATDNAGSKDDSPGTGRGPTRLLGRATHTSYALPEAQEVEYVDDPFETPRPAIVAYIEAESARLGKKRQLTPRQQGKLEEPVQQTEEYSPPDLLFLFDPDFKEWLKDQIKWACNGNKPTSSLIGAIRNYEREGNGWLDFKESLYWQETNLRGDHGQGTPRGTESPEGSQEEEDGYYRQLVAAGLIGEGT